MIEETVITGEEYTVARKFWLNDLSTMDENGKCSQAAIDFGAQGYFADALLGFKTTTKSEVRLYVTNEVTGESPTFAIDESPQLMNGVFMRRHATQSKIAYLVMLVTTLPGTYKCRVETQMAGGDNDCQMEWTLRVLPK